MYTTTIVPRFGDTDCLRHINNCAIAEWFESARRPMFEVFMGNPETMVEDWNLIMAHSDYDFLDEVKLAWDVEIRTVVSRIGTTSFTLTHEAWQRGKRCARGSCVLVHYDFAAKKPRPIPETIKERLRAHYHESGDTLGKNQRE